MVLLLGVGVVGGGDHVSCGFVDFDSVLNLIDAQTQTQTSHRMLVIGAVLINVVYVIVVVIRVFFWLYKGCRLLY